MSFLSRPLNIILTASVILSVLVLCIFIFASFFFKIEISFESYLTISLSIGLIAFVIFYLFIARYIDKEIRLIQKIISKRKNPKTTNLGISDPVFENLQEKAEEWAENQQKRIELLEEQADFRREFLGNLAHELKTPVFSIQGYILTLLEGGLEDETVNRSFLNKAMSGVDRITSVLDDLDDISKIEFNRSDLKLTKFDIVGLTRKIFDLVDKSANQKGIKVKLESNYESIMVFADKGKIGQVLTNLISNSISYGAENGTTVIKMHKANRKQLTIDVIDDGIGIEDIHLERLFERFYRIEKSRARNFAGSGLGLAIVKHIVEAHNQNITVNSTIGEGSEFSFGLELA
ncbi:MAG: sensor histidine kinase [Crocinitomicaceae bacterium]